MNPTRPTAGAAGTADKMCRTESGVNLDGLSGAEKIVYATASAWVSSGQTARPSPWWVSKRTGVPYLVVVRAFEKLRGLGLVPAR